MLYCPHCGKENQDHALFCVDCGQRLPGLPPGGQPPDLSIPQPAPGPNFWQNLGPDLRAALLTSAVVSGLQVLSDVLPGLGFVFSTPFAIIAYYLQGALTGRLARADPRFRLASPARIAGLGALSAVWTSVVISTLLSLLVVALASTVTIGTFLAAIPLILAFSALDILLNVGFSALGAWLYARSGGRGMLGVSLGVLTCGVLFACLLSLLVVVVLAGLGIAIFQGVSR